jgi:hypothetical protein
MITIVADSRTVRYFSFPQDVGLVGNRLPQLPPHIFVQSAVINRLFCCQVAREIVVHDLSSSFMGRNGMKKVGDYPRNKQTQYRQQRQQNNHDLVLVVFLES